MTDNLTWLQMETEHPKIPETFTTIRRKKPSRETLSKDDKYAEGTQD